MVVGSPQLNTSMKVKVSIVSLGFSVMQLVPINCHRQWYIRITMYKKYSLCAEESLSIENTLSVED